MQALSLKQLFIIIIIIANTVMETMWRDYAGRQLFSCTDTWASGCITLY